MRDMVGWGGRWADWGAVVVGVGEFLLGGVVLVTFVPGFCRGLPAVFCWAKLEPQSELASQPSRSSNIILFPSSLMYAMCKSIHFWLNLYFVNYVWLFACGIILIRTMPIFTRITSMSNTEQIIQFIQSSPCPEMKYDVQSFSRLHTRQQVYICTDIPAN